MSVTEQDFMSLLQDAVADDEINAATEEANESIERPVTMDPDEIKGIVQRQLSEAAGADNAFGGDQNEPLAAAMDYYFGRPRGDEIQGRSTQQSLDVADHVEAVLSEITPILSNHTQVAFSALGEDDEDQAQVESQLCNWVVMQKNSGYLLLHNATKDALLQKNGVVEVFIEERLSPVTEEYFRLTERERLEVLQPRAEGEEVYLVKDEPGEEGFNVEIKRVTKEKKLRIENVAPEDFRWYASHDSIDLKDCPFTARRSFIQRSDLLLEGFDPEIVDQLPAYNYRTDTVSLSRDQTYASNQSNYTSTQHALDPIEVWKIYTQIDEDGDGVAELRRITAAGSEVSEILEDIPWSHVPFASGSPYIMPHRYRGLSIFDKLWDVQDAKTSTLRQWDDNLENANNARVGVDQNAVGDWDSMLSSVPAGVVPFDGPPGQAVSPFPRDDIGQSCMQALDYYDRVAARRVGATLETQTRGQSIPGNVGSQGLDRLMTAEEQMAAMMARNIGETLIRNLYLLVHNVLRTSFTGQLTAKLGAQWVEENPSGWRPRDDINVTVGMSGAERARRMTVLSGILDRQVAFLGQGGNGIIVDHSKIHNTLVDMAETGNLSSPDRYWVDPESEQAKQRQQQLAQQSQAEQQAQMAAQQAQMQLQQQAVQAEVGKAQAQLMKAQLQRQNDAMRAQLQALKQGADATEAENQLALDYMKLIDQHTQWLTTLEANTGLELSKQAQQNAPVGYGQ